MDEDLEMEEQSAEMPIEGMDLQGLAAINPALAPFLQKYFSSMEAEGTTLRQQAANRQKQFEAAEEAIRQQRFGAPSTSEQLFALGAALLSPRRYTGFAGTLDKITPVFGKMDQLQRSAEAQRSEALEKLRREYLMGQDESAVAAARAQREGLGRIIPSVASATKPRAARTALAQNSERVINLDTAEEIVPVSANLLRVPPEAIEQLRAKLGDPNLSEGDKARERVAFETYYSVPVNRALRGE